MKSISNEISVDPQGSAGTSQWAMQVGRMDPDAVLRWCEAPEDASDSPVQDGVGSAPVLGTDGLIDQTAIAHAFSQMYLIPVFDPPVDEPLPVDRSVAESIPKEVCEKHSLAPLADDGFTLEVAVACPDGLRHADAIGRQLDRRIRPMFATADVVGRLIAALHDSTNRQDGLLRHAKAAEACDDPSHDERPTIQRPAEQVSPAERPSDEIDAAKRTLSIGAASESDQAIADLLAEAIRQDATDIHLEPAGDTCRIRIRAEGRLSVHGAFSVALYRQISDALKLRSRVRRSESRLPQEGGFTLLRGAKRFHVSLQTFPTAAGESMVLGLRELSAVAESLDALSMDPVQLARVRTILQSSHGLVAICGPRGSGKRATMQAFAAELNDVTRNVCSAERRGTVSMPGINQVLTCEAAGLGMTQTLQVCLNQDPDVVLLGEPWNAGTARLCADAASAGALVIGMMRSSDSLSGFRRLCSYGDSAAPFTSSLSGIIGQRSLRRLCDHCRRPTRPDRATAQRLSLTQDAVLYQAAGCDACDQSGYQGTMYLYEVIRIPDEIDRNDVWNDAGSVTRSASDFKTIARRQGVLTLAEQTRTHLLAGHVSVQDALRGGTVMGSRS
ncbi:putative type II secretion system protein E [Crateriforma conspicua]|uniref:Putative type II secretion system protein E n=1 Tax=Crateriforma conspicua TaxID=2527996 RepID=A0A5C6FP57_9PLAN|nr:ATPase, T2SS/T4P/T4SS family [Crateriforma conspicua]TWU63012.1 putative type II secretion system protein E [Crateriforma conspicua]